MGLIRIIRSVYLRIKYKYKPPSVFTKDILQSPNFEIGEYTYGVPRILDYGSDAKLTIGKYCSIAGDVKIFLGGEHRIDWMTTYPFSVLRTELQSSKDIIGHPASKGNVNIGNDVWIAHSATIMSGVTIGNGAVIGAGSVVASNVGAYEVWAGNPAKFIKKRFSDEDIAFLNEYCWWDFNDDKINAILPILSSGNVDLLKINR